MPLVLSWKTMITENYRTRYQLWLRDYLERPIHGAARSILMYESWSWRTASCEAARRWGSATPQPHQIQIVSRRFGFDTSRMGCGGGVVGLLGGGCWLSILAVIVYWVYLIWGLVVLGLWRVRWILHKQIQCVANTTGQRCHILNTI